MSITQNLNIEPYYDDFDDSKGYQRILFRPGYAVQARELTQIQTILQNQIEKFGKHIFKEGSMVTGGQTVYENENIYYVKLNATNVYNNDVDVSQFVGKFIQVTGSSTVRAYVLAAETATDTDLKTLVVKYFTVGKFKESDAIEDEDGLVFATVTSTAATGNASVVSINEGVFFVDGYFTKVNPQTLILEKYSTTPSYRVGLEVNIDIVSSENDTSLLDPALYASNFQAPGANRLQVQLVLSKREISSVDDSRFIELLRVESGIIKQKVVYPQYSVLEDTLARRTYDESGDYTVKPFTVSFSDDVVGGYANAYNIIVSPGKAYVKGYEFETISPSRISSERSREFNTVTNYPVNVNYQNYVDVTKLTGMIDIKDLTTLNVHCVNVASLNTSTATTLSATKIGTIRIRALDYQYGANTTSTDGAVYRSYVFDSNIGSVTANATGGSANTIILATDAATQTNAYVGVKLRITARAGVAQTESKIIQSYNAATRTATVDSNWQYGIPSSSTQYSLDFEFKDAESFVKSNTTNAILTSMNVSDDSKFSVLNDVYQGAYITEQNYNSLVFSLPNYAIKEGSIAETEYFGRKLYTSNFDGTGKLTFPTATGITSALSGTLSGSDAIDNFYVVLSSNGTTIGSGSIINFLNASNTVSVITSANASTVTINAPGAANATASVYMKVKLPYPETLGSIRKVKTRHIADIGNVSSTGADTISSGIDLFNAEVDQPGLQLNISNTNTGALKDPSQTQSLYVADVIKLRAVYDFGSNAITTANLASAVDITQNYVLDNGQTDNSYNHASIKLRNGFNGPTGNTVIFADYYSHTGSGYITVDSYVAGGTAYKDIPIYTAPNSGRVQYLRDCIDFRPRQKDGTSGLTGTYDEVILGTSGTSFETNFAYYLPRIDKLVVTKDRTFDIVKGVSSLTPIPPADRDDAMTIYILVLPAYVTDVESIKARFIENRRYTMRDIGEIEQRVQNLEYFSTLNLLEKVASDEQFLDDSTGLPRVKTGIVVDPFSGGKISDVTSEDYSAAIDNTKGEVRPSFQANQFRFEIDEINSTNYNANTYIVTPAYTVETFISQPMASANVSINPFNTVSTTGTTFVNAVDSQFTDEQQPPTVVDNIDGVNDSWAFCSKAYRDARNNGDLAALNTLLTAFLQSSDAANLEYSWRKHKTGYKCYKREWNWWKTKIKRKKVQLSALPVPSKDVVSGSASVTTNQYGLQSLDVNQNGTLSGGELESLFENWNSFKNIMSK